MRGAKVLRTIWRAWVRVSIAVMTLCALLAPGARAQGGAPEAPPAAGKLMQATAAPVTISRGGSATAVVKLAILPGWHVNANPPATEYNIPTKVSIGPAGASRPDASAIRPARGRSSGSKTPRSWSTTARPR